MSESCLPTVNVAASVYGPAGADAGDPAELFHEASKIYPSFAARQARGVRLLESSRELQASAARAVKRHRHLPAVELPAASFPEIAFELVLRARRSARTFAAAGLRLDELAALLYAAYGVTDSGGAPALPPLRAVPSGGALYPLELYCVASAVAGLEPGLYHYDPLGHSLEVLQPGDVRRALVPAMVFPELVESCPALFLVGSLFWRSRFKYGLRGYRFVLLEAGHLAQNLLLACAALRLAAVPLGGFYDRRVDELLGFDGVNESTLYAICVGREP